jgi:hypothetical protein
MATKQPSLITRDIVALPGGEVTVAAGRERSIAIAE